MQCPFCLIDFDAKSNIQSVSKDEMGIYFTESVHCTKCKRSIIFLIETDYLPTTIQSSAFISANPNAVRRKIMIQPRSSGRPPVSSAVPEHIAKDYSEACEVLMGSPKACAALGRRCLQNLLNDRGVSKYRLVDAIDEVLATERFPSHLHDSIDVIRKLGNIAAHPKEASDGTILEVEANEAEWVLETLEMLFEYYYLMPARIRAKREAFDRKNQG